MNISTVAYKDEEQFYQLLVKAGYPEDRIARKYQLDAYRVDFAILPPGLTQDPMAVIEVKRDLQFGKEWILAYASKLKTNYIFPIYLFCVEENMLIYSDTKNAVKTRKALPSYDELKRKWLKGRICFANLKLENFMAFESADFQFGSRLNVVIGENGSGKTQLLKLLYSIADAQVYVPATKTKELDYSRFSIKEIFGAKSYREFVTHGKGQEARVQVSFMLSGQQGEGSFEIGDKIYLKDSSALHTLAASLCDMNSAVFLPTHELLSIFPGFSSLDRIYRDKWPFDRTYPDCINFLGLPNIQSQEKLYNKIIKEVEKAIHGHIFLNEQGTRFLMQMEKSKAICEMPMVAEGWRKLGQLMQLMNTGAIHPGSILLWDEPEANLNPQLIRLLAKVIVLLARMDIQIFVTTHNLFFLRELELLTSSKEEDDLVRYFSLRRDGLEQAGCTADLQTILSFEEEISQEDRILGTK